jgi:enoyl-CoA hydratase/carnithine racemase
MTDETVRFEEYEGCAVFQINRPEVHNAVNDDVMGRLEEIQEMLSDRPDILVVILTGTGKKTFCAGGDIKYFSTLKTQDDALAMSLRMQAILNSFKSGNQVVIAAVNGNALGGGCEILTACHYRIAEKHAKFSFRQAANGIITGWGGGVRLFNQIARSDALRLLTTSTTINAQEALAIRFVNQVVPSSKAMETALDLAAQINRSSPSAVRAFLQILHEVDKGDFDAAVELETERFGDLWISDEFKHWLNSFLNNNSQK